MIYAVIGQVRSFEVSPGVHNMRTLPIKLPSLPPLPRLSFCQLCDVMNVN